MNCKEVKSLLSDYLDKELNADIEKEITDHLSSCFDCKQELDCFERGMKILKHLKNRQLPHSFLDFMLLK